MAQRTRRSGRTPGGIFGCLALAALVFLLAGCSEEEKKPVVSANLCLTLPNGMVLGPYDTSQACETARENMPEGTFWICRNENCNNEFNMSLSKVRSLRNEDGLVPCPKCNEWRVSRGHVCDSCKRVYEPVGHGGKPDNCPHCGEPIPMDEEVKRMLDPGSG